MRTSSDERLTRARRIRKRREFLRVQSSATKIRTHQLLLAITAPEGPPEEAESRLGVTITTKVDKRAARRNRLKRRIRHFFRRERAYFLRTVDLVVIALDGATELDYRAVAYQLRWGLRKAGVLKPKRVPREPAPAKSEDVP